ncbi:hypothetical protein [Solitalea canadensis]|uniref:hypothetical protein n=1 Tax=Solitalea canadensis TaxID=995 RepID=UPI0002FC0D84|nr:hypothetical protein [Solitalea canadensis]
MVYQTDFTINGWVKRAGNNYMIDIGKFIGGQVNLTKSAERDRKVDVYMPFARTFITVISLEIPQNYAVEGVKALNKSLSMKPLISVARKF